MKKNFPDFKADAEAEAFVETAEYDLSDMMPMRFELRRQDKSVSQSAPPGKYVGGGARTRPASRNTLSAIHSPGD